MRGNWENIEALEFIVCLIVYWWRIGSYQIVIIGSNMKHKKNMVYSKPCWIFKTGLKYFIVEYLILDTQTNLRNPIILDIIFFLRKIIYNQTINLKFPQASFHAVDLLYQFTNRTAL